MDKGEGMEKMGEREEMEEKRVGLRGRRRRRRRLTPALTGVLTESNEESA